MPQRSPVVKSIAGNFPGISRIRFDFSYGVVAEVLNQVWIDGTDKDSSIVEGVKDRHVIPASTFHNHSGLALKVLDEPGKGHLGEIKSEQHQMFF